MVKAAFCPIPTMSRSLFKTGPKDSANVYNTNKSSLFSPCTFSVKLGYSLKDISDHKKIWQNLYKFSCFRLYKGHITLHYASYMTYIADTEVMLVFQITL